MICASSNRFAVVSAACLVLGSLGLANACSRESGSNGAPAPATSSRRPVPSDGSSLPPSLTTFPVPTTAADSATAGSTRGSGPQSTRQVLEGFEEVTVRVRRGDGSVSEYCLLLAATEAQRQRGLMQVTDASLGGHPGMLFQFDEDETGGFWMKDTLLPLSIAFIRADGAVVSSTDMEPCPSGTKDCPTYPARGPYRYAVEVPKGRLASIGLDQPDGRLTVGPRSCPSP